MKKIIPIIVIIALVIGFKMYRKHQASNDVKEQAIEQMNSDFSSVLDKEYIQELVDYAHPTAMDLAYKVGGKRTSSSFDQNIYTNTLRSKMAEKLRSDNKKTALLLLTGQL